MNFDGAACSIPRQHAPTVQAPVYRLSDHAFYRGPSAGPGACHEGGDHTLPSVPGSGIEAMPSP